METFLTILGCGSSIGVPRIDGFWGKCNKKNKKNLRTRCSAVITKGRNSILIDTSPDVRSQLLSNNIKNISSVIFTHEHADQTNGLFELRPFFWKKKRKVEVYGNPYTINYLRKNQEYLFKKTNPYPAIIKSNIVKPNFTLGKKGEKITFKSFKVKHGYTSSVAYVFEKTAYISDCNDLSIVKNTNLQNLNFLIIDCLKLETHKGHFSLNESLYIHNCLKPKKTILTNLHSDLDYGYLKKKIPKTVIPAYDGLKIRL